MVQRPAVLLLQKDNGFLIIIILTRHYKVLDITQALSLDSTGDLPVHFSMDFIKM